MNFKLISVLAAGLLSVTPALASTVTLDFEGATSYASINGFYNGGTDSEGASGTNYGIFFGGDALGFSNDPDFPNYSNAPTPGTILAPVGADAALNAPGRFSGTASFFYSSSAATLVEVWSGLNGTGTLLGSFSLLANAQNGCSDTLFCHWDLATLNFAGEAQSILFGNAAGAGFDNVTINTVPLPAAIWLMFSALGGFGAFVRRQQIA